MANTLPDVMLTGVWVDVYAATGLTVGNKIQIQNKSSSPMLLQIQASKPTEASLDGWMLYSGMLGASYEVGVSDIPAGSSVYVKGTGRINVQDLS